jgi:pimeloyl-ACP methyl ester carboxylesterase
VTLPGHGQACDAPPGYWDYGRIAQDVLEIADKVKATRAVGVSLGAGALIRTVAEHPARFERMALLLPAVLDKPRSSARLELLADAVGEPAALRALVAAEIPTSAEAGDYVDRRTAALSRLGGAALRSIAGHVAVPDAARLAAVEAEVLVLGAMDDPLHPEETARSVAEGMGNARCVVLTSSAPMLTHRREIRGLLTRFLS